MRVRSRRGWAILAAFLVLVGCALALAGLPGGDKPASAAGDPVIAAAGDIACDPANHNFNNGNGQNGVCMQKATYTLLTSINPVAVLTLGDNQYYCNSLAAYNGSYALSWGTLLSKTYPAPGNHEYLTDGGSTPSETTGCDSTNANAFGYFSYFAAAAKEGTPGQGWYSYDVGSWHLIALNSNCGNIGGCGTTSSEGSFVASDLAAHQNQCILAYWHIPVWSSGGRAAANMQSVVTQLYNAHADVILNGHDHIYERFAPQNASAQSDPTNGLREFIVGSGGANHTSIATVAANSLIRDTSSYGVLKLTLHSGSYDWQFVPIAGASFTDSGSATCHASGGGGTAPPAPSVTLSTTDANDYIPTGTTNVFYRQGQAGAFTVTATSAGASSMSFPVVFGGDALVDNTSPFSTTYSWGSANSQSGSFGVIASSSGGSSSPTQFTVTPDNIAPTTAATCNGGSCTGSFGPSATVALTATDTGSGPKTIYYTTDGTTPTTSSPAYAAPFTVTSTKTIKFFAVDNVGNTEAVKSQVVMVGEAVALVQQKAVIGTVASLPVTMGPATGAGHTLVAVIAIAAGSSPSVTTVTDSAGPAGSWVKGPTGFLSGANTRLEIWYRLNAPPVTSVTVTLSASNAMSVNVLEWSGLIALDKSAGGNHKSSTSVKTPSITTTNPNDLVIGAMNYPAAATSTLSGTTFTSLPDPPAGSSVHQRAAYKLASSVGSFQVSWNLSAESGGNGAAIIAFKANASGPDTTPPTTPVLAPSTTDPSAFVSGSTVFYRPSVASSTGFTVGATTTDSESPVSVQFPDVFVSGDGGPVQTSSPFSKTYNWASGASASGAKTVTATSNGGSSSASFTVSPDSVAPSSSVTCGGVACAGPYSSSVGVAFSADDGSGSGVAAGFYTTDGSDPTSSGNPSRVAYATPYTASVGTTTIKYAAVDRVGNVEGVKTLTVVVAASAPPAPTLQLAATDGVDYVSGTTVFINPGSPPGSFTVTGTSSGADTIVFPNVFGSDGGSAAPSVAHLYSWVSNPLLAGPTSYDVKASTSGTLSTPTSFTVSADSVAPSSSVSCSPGPCGGGTGTQSVSLSASDSSGSGVREIHYTLDGSTPTLASPVYASALSVTQTTTVEFFAVDNVGNTEAVQTVAVVVAVAKPAVPSLTLTALGAGGDYVSGSTEFFNPNAVSGSFRVDASSVGADSIVFPDVFVFGDGGSVSGSSASKTYSWSTGAVSLSLSFAVTGGNAGGQSDPVSFTVSADSVAPSSSVSCSPGPCGGGTGTQSVSLSASDSSGSGVREIHYTLDGSTPTLASPVYASALSVTQTTTVEFFAVDNVGNTEAVQTQSITITPGGASLVRQVTNSSPSTSSLTTSLSPAAASGNTLVAVVVLQAGSSASVSSVSDSGGAWTKGPVGFLTGVNSRVEIWYRLSAPAVSSVSVTLSSAKAVAVSISEWSGVTGFERSSSGNGVSSTTITTPVLTTTNPRDLVIAATNFPVAATSTLTAGSFTSLQDFNSGSGVHGRAAYVTTSSTGSFQGSWSLSVLSGGHGTAILALTAS